MKRELHLIAHDIRSLENVGALFRTADSLGITKLWLTGYTAAPPDARISKVALGAETAVPFEAATDITEVFRRLNADGIPVFALELTKDAIDLAKFAPPDRLAILLGTETTGIPPSLIEKCDGVVKIDQRGIKESMNVAVAAGITAWVVLNYR